MLGAATGSPQVARIPYRGGRLAPSVLLGQAEPVPARTAVLNSCHHATPSARIGTAAFWSRSSTSPQPGTRWVRVLHACCTSRPPPEQARVVYGGGAAPRAMPCRWAEQHPLAEQARPRRSSWAVAAHRALGLLSRGSKVSQLRA